MRRELRLDVNKALAALAPSGLRHWCCATLGSCLGGILSSMAVDGQGLVHPEFAERRAILSRPVRASLFSHFDVVVCVWIQGSANCPSVHMCAHMH